MNSDQIFQTNQIVVPSQVIQWAETEFLLLSHQNEVVWMGLAPWWSPCSDESTWDLEPLESVSPGVQSWLVGLRHTVAIRGPLQAMAPPLGKRLIKSSRGRRARAEFHQLLMHFHFFLFIFFWIMQRNFMALCCETMSPVAAQRKLQVSSVWRIPSNGFPLAVRRLAGRRSNSPPRTLKGAGTYDGRVDGLPVVIRGHCSHSDMTTCSTTPDDVLQVN